LKRSSVEKEFFATVRPSSLIKRFASIEEVASLVIFMASPLSSATNGAALRVDGGVNPLDHLKKTTSDSLAARTSY